MKSLRLLFIAVLACACTVSAAQACDAHKSSKSKTSATTAVTAAKTGAHAGCTAEMAANCTPAMRAACEQNAAVAAAMGCEGKGVTNMTVLASAKGKPASKGGDCCAMKGARSATTAVVAGAAHHADCAACLDWSTCEQDVRTLGSSAQVVPLKNGAMIVYTAESPAQVRALQSVVAKRHDRMVAALAAGSSQKLCDDCKQLRGAIASGKLHREVVNVERGCMALITSTDRGVVQKIRAMTGQPPVAVR